MRVFLLFFSLVFSIQVFSQELPQFKLDFASQVWSSDGRIIGFIGEKNRVDVRSTGYVSKFVLWSLIATEDREFYNHDGVSYRGLVRGLLKTFTGRAQGGSTLTMQLARNLFLTHERTISRKLTEIELAQKLEKKYTKDQILLLYLNTVLFGRGIYGIWAAAEEYFSKTPDKLTITESASLVGLLKNPGGYDPYIYPEKTLARRNEVLYNLVEVGKISEKEFYKLKSSPLNLKLNEHLGKHFVEHVRREAIDILKPSGYVFQRDELKIVTTLNYEVQKAAEDAVKWQWNNLPQSTKEAQVGLVSVESGTGMIRAMIGGNPTSESRGLNHADQIKRQPGSAFKTFLYGEMLQNGYTLGHPLLDAPIVVDSGKPYEWRPSNSDEKYSNTYIPMETAIEHSVNLCAAYAISNITIPDSVVSFSREVGITSEIPPLYSIALGTGEVSPLEMAASYSVFASMGTYAEPFSIIRIEDKNGSILYSRDEKPVVVLDSATAFLMTEVLKKVVDGGTGSSVRKYYKGFAAGKTGTTQNSTDVWFVGYNPKLTTAIWIGYDDQSRKLSGGFQYGSSACAPIWGRMMASVTRSIGYYNSFNYSRPLNVRDTLLCMESGELATVNCKKKETYPVNFDKLPSECTIHGKRKPQFDIYYGW